MTLIFLWEGVTYMNRVLVGTYTYKYIENSQKPVHCMSHKNQNALIIQR
jgi:hypothetical protein